LSKARKGSQTASANVRGGRPGTSGSGAQIVAAMVAAMRQATKRKARRQPRLAAIHTSTAPASIAAVR
jgi:hypothetical protein